MTTKNILITGAFGYIGSTFINEYFEKYNIFTLDTNYFGISDNLKSKTKKNLIKDIRDVSEADLKEVDIVVHMSELSNDPMGELQPNITKEINVYGTNQLISAANNSNISKFIYMSSCSVYGFNESFANENTGVNPLTEYAKSKVENEENLFALDFRMSSDGLVLKTAIPSSNPRFLNSCRGWAGNNCGLSEAQKAEFARLAELAKAKSLCLSNYSKWLSDSNSGEYASWNDDSESCTLRVFAFEGIPVNTLEAVEQALKAKYGRACSEWRQAKKESNSTSPNGNPETKNPECGGVKYWFYSGKEFTSQSSWTEEDNKVKKQTCVNDRNNAISTKKTGEYTYGPTPGPDPCGKTVWFCKGTEYISKTDYLTTTCVKQDDGGKDDKCKNFKPPNFCQFIAIRHPLCECK